MTQRQVPDAADLQEVMESVMEVYSKSKFIILAWTESNHHLDEFTVTHDGSITPAEIPTKVREIMKYYSGSVTNDN